MNSKKKIVAAAAALLIGATGYGVYATSMTVANASPTFAAGSTTAGNVTGFGAVKVNAYAPEFDAKTKVYYYSDMGVTPTDGALWTAVSGKTVYVVGYDKDGKEVTTGNAAITATGSQTQMVPLSKADANAIATWGVVVR